MKTVNGTGHSPCVFCGDRTWESEGNRVLFKALPTDGMHCYFFAHYACFKRVTVIPLSDIEQSLAAANSFQLT